MGDDEVTAWIVSKPMEIHIDRKQIKFIVKETRGNRKVAETLANLRGRYRRGYYIHISSRPVKD